MSHDADRRLVDRMGAGDEEAYSEFAERYPPALYRFALARLDGDGELARDLVQTAMTKALAKLDTYRASASLFTWLCACCKNEILMYRRSRASAPVQVAITEQERAVAAGAGLPHSLLSSPPGPEDSALDRERATQVHLTLDLLPEHYARALEWKYVDHLPIREIALRLDLGEKAAESLLTRARSAFRDEYERLTGSEAP